tara:strand:+ start:270 stop:1457 length:1188 start_codon:yes stop_codon:yes gene_type:complete
MEVLIVILIIAFLIWAGNKDNHSGPELSPNFEIRIEDKTTEEGNKPYKAIQCKGVFPQIYVPTDIAFVTSILDETDGSEDLKPVISTYRDFQETDSLCFQDRQNIGVIKPDHGFVKWVTIARIPIDGINPPESGERDLIVVVRMIDVESPTIINHGFHSGPDSLYQKNLEWTHNFSEIGYEENTRNKNTAREYSIKLGMSIAMADGKLDRSEGETIKSWISDILDEENKSLRNELKENFNNSLKNSHEELKSGELKLDEIIKTLNQIADNSTKIEALKLCYDIMAADGIADHDEINLLNKISNDLGIDENEINNIRDKAIINIDTESISISDDLSSSEKLLGINKNWSMDRKLSYLTEEFQKWSQRINSFSDPQKREKAQNMIDAIAIVRNSYEL